MRDKSSQIIPVQIEEGLPLVDCHCHYPDKEPYRKPLMSHHAEYDLFFEENDGQFIITSGSEWDYDFIQEFMETHDKIYFTMGVVNPSDRRSSEKFNAKRKTYIDFLINNTDKYIAIGEFGLDFHHAKTLKMRKEQIHQFRKIIQETKQLNKPYVLHVRNPSIRDIDQKNPDHEYNSGAICNKIILDTLEEEKIPPSKVMWHCFSGPAEWGPKIAEKGYYISVPSSAFGFKRWRRNIKGIPLENILTETDACFQHPFKMGTFNTPANVKYSVAAIAYEKDIKQKKVANQVLENAKKLFGI